MRRDEREREEGLRTNWGYGYLIEVFWESSISSLLTTLLAVSPYLLSLFANWEVRTEGEKMNVRANLGIWVFDYWVATQMNIWIGLFDLGTGRTAGALEIWYKISKFRVTIFLFI